MVGKLTLRKSCAGQSSRFEKLSSAIHEVKLQLDGAFKLDFTSLRRELKRAGMCRPVDIVVRSE
jgi:hypothetical protein